MPDTDKDEEKQGATAADFYQPPPKLPIFSGEQKHASFENWEFEIRCMQKEKIPTSKIIAAIRRSLQGQAILTLRSIGINNINDLETILLKFKSVYGSTISAQTVLSNFFQIKQNEGETAGNFAMRLENCLTQAIELGRVNQSEKEQMLREAFHSGLNTQLKMGVDYLFSLGSISFDQLVVKVKTKEIELGLTNKAKVNAIQANEIEKLTAQVAQLKTQLQEIEKLKNPTCNHTQSSDHPGQFSGHPGQFSGHPGQFSGTPGNFGRNPNNFGGQRGPRNFVHRQRHTFRPRQTQPSYGQNTNGPRLQYPTPVICWKCNQPGHLQRGCRNTLN